AAGRTRAVARRAASRGIGGSQHRPGPYRRSRGGAAFFAGADLGSLTRMANALLLGYGLDQPSFRHRMRSIVGPLQAGGWQVRTERFPSGRYGVRTWERRELLRWADVAILHQIKLSSLEARLFASLTRHKVFDVDDAIYVRKPRRLGDPVHDS